MAVYGNTVLREAKTSINEAIVEIILGLVIGAEILLIAILIAISSKQEKNIKNKINNDTKLQKIIIKYLVSIQNDLKKIITKNSKYITFDSNINFNSNDFRTNYFAKDVNETRFIRFKIGSIDCKKMAKDILNINNSYDYLKRENFRDHNPDDYPIVPKEIKSILKYFNKIISEINSKNNNTKIGSCVKLYIDNFTDDNELNFWRCVDDSKESMDILVEIYFKDYESLQLDSNKIEEAKKML